METVHYRGLGKAIMREVNEIDNNWLTGNYKKIKTKGGDISTNFITRMDYLADFNYCEWVWNDNRKEKLEFHTRTSITQCCIVVPDGSFAVTNTEIVVVWDTKHVQILDTDGQLICEVPELDECERISRNLASCCISGDHMAVISHADGQ